MPTIANTTRTVAQRFVDRLYGVFGVQTVPTTTSDTLPKQSGHPIALQFSVGGELYNRIRVELDRLRALDDVNRMLEEDGFLAGNIDKRFALVENYEPRIRFQGARSAAADKITQELLRDRLRYFGMRGDLLWRLVMWGDLFLQ